MHSLWMVVASLLFACMGVCVKLGAARFGTGELVFFRGFVAMLLIAAVARGQGVSLATPHWRLQVFRAVSGSLALVCYFYALTVLPLATAVTLSYTSPMFVALLLGLWFRERLGWPALGAVALGFVGVALLLRPTLQSDQWLGAAVGLGSGLMASIAYVNVRELGRAGEPEARTVFWFSGLTALVALPWMLAHGRPGIASADAAGLAVLVGVGLFGGLAQLAMTRAYRFGQTIVSASLAYTTVVFASLFGVALWGETLAPGGWQAIALIIASGVGVSLASRPRAAATAGGTRN